MYKRCANWKDAVICLVGSALFLALFVFIFGSRFETHDDYNLFIISTGMLNQPSPMLTYVNYIYGLALTGLQAVVPTINWYLLTQWILLCASIATMSWLVVKICGRTLGYPIGCALMLILLWDLAGVFQYTKNANLAILAGLLLAVLQAREGKWGTCLLGIILAIIGFWLRWICVFTALPFVGLLVLLLYCHDKKDAGTAASKPLFRAGAALLLFCVLAAGTQWFSTSIYQSSDEWRDYLQLNNPRTQLYDYNRDDNEDNIDLYLDQGMSLTDINAFFFEHLWSDTEVFNVSKLRDMARIKPGTGLLPMISRIRMTMAEALFDDWLGIFFLFSLLMYAYFSKDSAQKKCAVSLLLFVCIGLYCVAFAYLGRTKHRITFVLWLAAAFSLLHLGDLHRVAERIPTRRIAAFTAALAVFGLCLAPHSLVMGEPDRDQDAANLLEYTSQSKDDVFMVFDAIFYPAELPTDIILSPSDSGSMSNIVILAGWISIHPSAYANLHRANMRNAFREMVDNEHVYLLTPEDWDRNPPVLIDYIREHYNPSATLQFKKREFGTNFYQVITT